MTDTPQPQVCPACGQSNQCALANPISATRPCWCFSVQIDPQALERVPADLRNRACLCPRCAGVLLQETDAP